MPHPMFEKHSTLLHQAMVAVETREFWGPYAENPTAYGDHALDKGRAAFDGYREASFYLDQPGVVDRVGDECSPYGLALKINYPRCDADALIAAARTATPAWNRAGVDTRVGVCMEILARLNENSVEMAHAVMHTTGQPFLMAFRHSVVGAQERGLEAIAVAYREMRHVPESAVWEKPQGTRPPLIIEKTFTITPRGVGLIIASAVAPTLSSYPALFANLATGNAVIVKAHPEVILPMAISVAIARATLKEAGFDPNLVTLLVDSRDAPSGKLVALKSEIRLIDFTGNSEFGRWLEESATQASVFAQTSSVNCVVIDSTTDYVGLLRNLTLSLCWHSGQTCTSPRLVLVSQEGVRTPDGLVSCEQFGKDLALAVGRLAEDPARAVEVLGAIRSSATIEAIDAVADLGEVLREAQPVSHPQWPEARVRTPLLLKMSVTDEIRYATERWGPVAALVDTRSSAESLAVAERVMREHGALSFAVYSTNARWQQLATEIALRVGVALSLNLTGGLLIAEESGFSDVRGSGVNPASGAASIDSAFVARRFQVIVMRRPAPREAV
jgi:phenylacetic acid degradation protein paaN